MAFKSVQPTQFEVVWDGRVDAPNGGQLLCAPEIRQPLPPAGQHWFIKTQVLPPDVARDPKE